MQVGRPLLVRGVTWSDGAPSLSLCSAQGTGTHVPLSGEVELRFHVLTPPAVRHCLGYSEVRGPRERTLSACPTHSNAERGFQCGTCFARDDFRHLHDIHRSGNAPPGMQAYVDQEHWLYVATFADGATKVGTASHRSKFTRLAEQGAVAARYVAWAHDGRVIRHLEDAVTERLGLVQAVRSASKFAALANPLPAHDVDQVNSSEAARVRQMLDDDGGLGAAVALSTGDGFDSAHSVEEQWTRPAGAGAVCETETAIPYPHDVAAGSHGLKLAAVHGSFAKADIDDSATSFLVDLGKLKGKRIEFGPYQSEVPAVQEFLF